MGGGGNSDTCLALFEILFNFGAVNKLDCY